MVAHLREGEGGMVPMDKDNSILLGIINYCQCLSRISCAGFLGRAIIGAGRMEWEGLWVMEQGLAELAAEGLPPVDQSAPLNVPKTFCTEILKFLPAMPEAHPGCTVFVSITCLNNGCLNNNKQKLCIYKLTFKKAMASDITPTVCRQNAGY